MAYKAEPIPLYGIEPIPPGIEEIIKCYISSQLEYHNFENDLILYHYSNLNGIKGILSNRSFFCTNIEYVNDNKEINYGISLINEIIADEKDEKSKSFRNIVGQVFDKCIIKDIFNFFITCFSENNNLERQWKEYADEEKGCCIGIDFNSHEYPSFINYSDNLNMPGSKQCKAALRKVIYNRDEQVNRAKDCFEFYKNLANDKVANQYMPHVAMHAANAFFELSTYFKDYQYKDENEWRLLYYGQPKCLEKSIKIKEFEGKKKEYLELFLYKDVSCQRIFPLTSIALGKNNLNKKIRMELKESIDNTRQINNQISIRSDIEVFTRE
jgi:hypothetical protein